jgi:hypothetical protein
MAIQPTCSARNKKVEIIVSANIHESVPKKPDYSSTYGTDFQDTLVTRLFPNNGNEKSQGRLTWMREFLDLMF